MRGGLPQSPGIVLGSRQLCLLARSDGGRRKWGIWLFRMFPDVSGAEQKAQMTAGSPWISDGRGPGRPVCAGPTEGALWARLEASHLLSFCPDCSSLPSRMLG